MDVWALGVLVLELVAGEAICIEKPEGDTKGSGSEEGSEVSIELEEKEGKREGKVKKEAVSN